jgi:7,8-dihydroneopterin aldolase/epimerase/oxygenase
MCLIALKNSYMIVELFDLRFYAYHGLYQVERDRGGDFVVDVVIETDDKPSYHNLEDVVNYEEVYRIVQEQMTQPRDFIEEVARAIKQQLLQHFQHAKQVQVTLTKCAPPIEGMSGSARVRVH